MINFNGTTTGYGANTAKLANVDIRLGNSAVPINGLYSPAANQLAISTAGTGRVFIDSSGRLLVGTSAARTNLTFGGTGIAPLCQIESTGSDSSFSIIRNATNNLSNARLVLAKNNSASLGTNVLVDSGEVLGEISFSGNDGSNFISGAVIVGEVDGTPSTNDMPGRLVFSVTADGASSPTEACRINNQRELLIGTTTRTANGGVLQVSNGITFPGTQSACSDPNTLDDYEEGTWTPVISDGTNNATMNASTTGRYTKLGNQVTIFAYVTTTSLGSVSGSIRITGLPFTSSSINYSGCAAAQGLGLNITAGQSVGVRPLQSVTYANLYLWDDVAGTSDMLATEWSADGGIIFSLSYFV